MIPATQNDQYDFNPTNYADAGNSAVLPLPGEYSIRALGAKFKQKDGQTVTYSDAQGNTYRVISIPRVEIVEPTEEGGQFTVFQDVSSKPFPRKGLGGKQVPVSNVMDAIRAIDVNLAGEPQGWDDAADVLLREYQSGSTFNARLGYKVLDIEGAKAELENVDKNDREAVNKAFRKHTYYTKAFRNADGTYNSAIKTPDGRILEPKLVIEAFVASNKRGKVGSFQTSK